MTTTLTTSTVGWKWTPVLTPALSPTANPARATVVPMKRFNPYVKISRAGVVPWCFDKISGERKFWWGVHSFPRELTDFGGTVSKSEDDGNPLHAAYREFSEEGKRAWGMLPISSHHESMFVYYEDMLIIFLQVPDMDVNAVKNEFKYNLSRSAHREVVGIVCVREADVKAALTPSLTPPLSKVEGKSRLVGKSGFPFYSKVSDLLSKLPSFEFLK